jgi:uncharacterized protein (DUF305 family)
MFRSTIVRRSMLAAVSGAAIFTLSACGGESGGGHDMSNMAGASPSNSAPAAATAPSADFNDADVMFAQMMIPHHEQAVEMSELAETRASDKEVKELAAKIKAAQDPEIRTLKGWLDKWGKPASSHGGMDHGMPGMMTEEDMKKLADVKGKAFDRMFAELMIAHHNGAIDMARTELRSGANAEAKEMAKAIESSQQAEVAQMRKLLERL